MRDKTFIIAMAMMATMATTACTDNNDTDVTKPTIDLIEPEDGAELRIGSANGVHFEAEFADDVMLSSYKVDIHNNFDGHNHSSNKAVSTTDFTYTQSWSLSGHRNQTVHHHEIRVPADATPGKYH